MMTTIPVLEAEEQAYLLSWLHDGVTLRIGTRTRTERLIRKMQNAVAKEAAHQGIETVLEVKLLPIAATAS